MARGLHLLQRIDSKLVQFVSGIREKCLQKLRPISKHSGKTMSSQQTSESKLCSLDRLLQSVGIKVKNHRFIMYILYKSRSVLSQQYPVDNSTLY